MSVAGIDDDDEKWLNAIKSKQPANLGEDLFKAARTGDIWRVETLLHHGADINFREGRALLAAVSQKHHKIVEFLIEKKIHLDQTIKNDALGEAAAQGDPVMVRKFLELGADANDDNASALWLAIPRGDTEVIRILLAGGADVNARDKEFLCVAISHGHPEAAKLLLQFGADPEVFYRDMDALEWSINIGLREVSDMIRAGDTGVVMTRDYFVQKPFEDLLTENATYPGYTGLHLAAKAGHFDVVRDKLLQDKDSRLQTADLTRQTLAGQNVLFLLAKTEQLGALFDPALWAGRRDEMVHLHQNHVPPIFQAQVDIAALAATVDRIGLKAQAPRYSLRPQGPKGP